MALVFERNEINLTIEGVEKKFYRKNPASYQRTEQWDTSDPSAKLEVIFYHRTDKPNEFSVSARLLKDVSNPTVISEYWQNANINYERNYWCWVENFTTVADLKKDIENVLWKEYDYMGRVQKNPVTYRVKF